MICIKCKHDNEYSSKFCSHCGSEIISTDNLIRQINGTTNKHVQQEPLEEGIVVSICKLIIENGNLIVKGSLIFIALLIIISMFSNGSDTNTSKLKPLFAKYKTDICKGAIALTYNKSIHVIKLEAIDSNGTIRVYYDRQVDDSRWHFVCSFKNNKVTYAGWDAAEQVWGRWRDDDTVSFKVSPRDGGKYVLQVVDVNDRKKTYAL
jgi:hypothetical protein